MADQRFLSARVDGNEAPVSPCSASVPWWSFTKTALATVALQLVAQGHLSLDDLIDSRPYTLRQLLQHRAGVPDYSGLAAYHEAIRQGDKPWGVPELLSRTAADQLDFEPGNGLALFKRRLSARSTDNRRGDRPGPRQHLSESPL